MARTSKFRLTSPMRFTTDMQRGTPGVSGISENQARNIRFDTTNLPHGLISSICCACGHQIISDFNFGENLFTHNRRKREHRDQHYWGRADNSKLLPPSR